MSTPKTWLILKSYNAGKTPRWLLGKFRISQRDVAVLFRRILVALVLKHC